MRLPYPGTVAFIAADPLADGCWFALDSWVKPAVLCYGAADGKVTLTDIAPKPDIDVSRYESREVMVKARDGVKVPLSIIYAKACRATARPRCISPPTAPTASTSTPASSPACCPGSTSAASIAVAHVRGGGELGEDWHKAGQKMTKPNTWRDCIDCAEHLIAERLDQRAPSSRWKARRPAAS